MDRHEVIVMGRRASYWERNPHGHQTIVLLHGFRGNHKGLTDFSRSLEGFRLIMPDLPGYGESESLDTTHTMEHYAEWLDEFISIVGIENWVSWSHSYGCIPALIQAANGKHKPKMMVMVSLAAIGGTFGSALSTLYYRIGNLLPYEWHRRWVASRFVDRTTGRWLFTYVTTKRRLELMDRGSRNLLTLKPNVVHEQYMSGLRVPLDEYAQKLTMPVLMIAGAKDQIVSVKRLQRLVSVMPDSELVVMTEMGHLAPIEKPAATAAITKRFINGTQKPGEI